MKEIYELDTGEAYLEVYENRGVGGATTVYVEVNSGRDEGVIILTLKQAAELGEALTQWEFARQHELMSEPRKL